MYLGERSIPLGALVYFSWFRLCYVAVCNNYAICNTLQTALNCNAVCNTSYFIWKGIRVTMLFDLLTCIMQCCYIQGMIIQCLIFLLQLQFDFITFHFFFLQSCFRAFDICHSSMQDFHCAMRYAILRCTIIHTPSCHYCPPLSRKRGDIKSHSSVSQSVRQSVSPSVTKFLTLAITFALLQVELWYLACVLLPFSWYHVVTLTVTFDLLQGQICCRAGDHNSLNLLVLTSSCHYCFVYANCNYTSRWRFSRRWSLKVVDRVRVGEKPSWEFKLLIISLFVHGFLPNLEVFILVRVEVCHKLWILPNSQDIG